MAIRSKNCIVLAWVHRYSRHNATKLKNLRTDSENQNLTLKMVCSGFLMGSQLNMGRGTLGTTGFFIGTPGNPPPMGGGGGTVHVWVGDRGVKAKEVKHKFQCDATTLFMHGIN